MSEYQLTGTITQSDLDFALFIATRIKHKVARERFRVHTDADEYDKVTAENLAFIRNYQLRPVKHLADYEQRKSA